jgi:nitroimidazol reductase NimA-like FMN-containing flavoprotein (pyridoxamine 5'-phosphate oxidase superfamily)
MESAMVVEMTAEECRELLGRVSLGRLGCALENQPYVVPINFAFEGDYLFVLSTEGQKTEWMRENPKVCVEVDEIVSQAEWVSVIVTGTYQDLPEPQFTEVREHGRKLLEKRSLWWHNALGERQLKSESELIAITFFRIHADSITGLRSTTKAK